jgi:DNA invertase Pin-like site-specific DNA recombinase
VGQVLRISKDVPGLGLGVERQRIDTDRLAATHGWTIVETYSDNDRSAFRGRFGRDGRWVTGRPEYDRCLDDLRAGRIKGLVAYHPDRVLGHPRELEDLIDLIDRTGVQIATVLTGSYDLTTAPGRYLARQLAAASRYEREIKSEREQRMHLALAQAGKISGGGIRPFGFEADRVTVRESEAAIVREIANRVAAGESLRGVTADLNRRAVATVTGGPWNPFVVRRLLLSARIAGLRSHRGEVAADALWPAIVDRSTWEAVCRLLKDPARRTNRHPRSYLLTGGLARCALCGAQLHARPKADGRRCYICASGPGFSGCGKIRILADPLEGLVVDELLRVLDGDGLDRALAQRRDEPPSAAALGDVERQLDELAGMWAAGKMGRREWLSARQQLEARRVDLAATLAVGARGSVLRRLVGPGTLRERWEALPSFDLRRAVLAGAIDRVMVGPAVRGRNFFDTARVLPPKGEIVWRV